MTGRRKYRDNAVTKKGGRLIAVGGLLVTSAGVVGAASLPAGAQTTSSSATNFSGAAIGNLLSIDALNIPGTLNLANAQVAPALAEVNSAGGIMAGTGTPSAGVTGGGTTTTAGGGAGATSGGGTGATSGGGTGATSGNFTSHGHATNLNANVLSSGSGTGLGGLTGILGGGTGGTSLGSLSNLLGMGGTSGGSLLGGILGGATGTATGSSAGNMCVSNQNGGISLNNLVVCADQTAPPDNLNPVINTLLPLSSSGTPITSGTGSLGSGALSGLLGGGLAGSGGTGSAILAGNAVTACALAHDPNLPSTSGTGTGATGTHCLNAPGLGTSTTSTTTPGGTGGTGGAGSSTSPTTCPTTNANGSGGSVTLPASTNAGIQSRSTTSLADIVLGSGTGLGGLLGGLESLNPASTATGLTAGLAGLSGLSIRIVSPNILCATALGVPGGASVTFTPAVVQIVQGANANGSGGTVVSNLSSSNQSTNGLSGAGGLGGLLGTGGLLNINLGMPVNVKTAADGTSASAQSSLLTISIGLGSLLNSTTGGALPTGGTGGGLPIPGGLLGGAGGGLLGGATGSTTTTSTTTAAAGTGGSGGTGATVPTTPGTPTPGTQLLNIQVAPMAVAANAPVGGINCATANCNPGGGGISPVAATAAATPVLTPTAATTAAATPVLTPTATSTLTSPVNPLAQGRNSVADASVLSGILSLPGTSSTDNIVQLVNTPVAGTTPPSTTPTPGAGVPSPTGPSAAGPGGNGNAGNGGTLPFTGEHPWIPIAAGGLLGAGLLGVGIRRRMAHSS